MTLIDRARKCLATRPVAVSGQNGHSTTFSAACLLVWGFGLEPEEALPLMLQWNEGCQPPWKQHELLHKLRSAMTASHKEPRGHMVGEVSERGAFSYSSTAAAVPEKKRKRQFDLEALKRVQRLDWKVDFKWISDRSPVDPATVTDEMYLSALYKQGEKVLIYTGMRSMGDYGFVVGKGFYKLGKVPGEPPVPIGALPEGSDEGMTFGMQPVDGKWNVVYGKRNLSRRTRASITRYPYMLLESDAAPHDLWLNWLAQCKLPVVSITLSGGRSLHALVKLGVDTREEWDDIADVITPLLTKAGCDGQALHSMVYPRFPNKMRRGKVAKGGIFEPYRDGPRKQRLIYFNPNVRAEPIGMKEVRRG